INLNIFHVVPVLHIFYLLLFFHIADTLVPIVTVELGEPVTLTCAFTDNFQSTTWLHWYKQNAGDTLNLIVSQQHYIKPTYGPEFSASRFNATNTKKMSNLTILKTVQEDEGMYHCTQTDMYGSTINSERTMSYTVVQQPAVSHPRRPNDSMTLQCLVLSNSTNTTCSEEPRVFWFKAGSNKSHPDIIYTDGKKAGNCDKRFDSQDKCIYNFSKSFSSSDAGTYYCAVATCGQIVFGNGTSLKNGMNLYQLNILRNSTFEMKVYFSKQTEAGPDLNYAALHFSEGRTSRGKKKRELMTEDSVYSQVKGSV
uniref:Ig-like domain-containing protein n=1 Tax=Poecilia reticulata TaxID=8081 RepID=A0A3P9PHG4_POERE